MGLQCCTIIVHFVVYVAIEKSSHTHTTHILHNLCSSKSIDIALVVAERLDSALGVSTYIGLLQVCIKINRVAKKIFFETNYILFKKPNSYLYTEDNHDTKMEDNIPM